eukprot:914912-Amphidinium_carterae.2
MKPILDVRKSFKVWTVNRAYFREREEQWLAKYPRMKWRGRHTCEFNLADPRIPWLHTEDGGRDCSEWQILQQAK